VNAEVTRSANIYARRGLLGLSRAIGTAPAAGANLYLAPTPTRTGPSGMAARWRRACSDSGLSETAYRRLEDSGQINDTGAWALPKWTDGFRLLIGRDLENGVGLVRDRRHAAQWSILVGWWLVSAAGLFVARRVLRRIETP